ncbi:MAG TPA: phosphotriesterase-related protein [Streptosporangiaceae bacterium]|jgi:phosphotriesterase-related protein|nr:phosphotriesterase-related protein [Streptosporangiaceae bacterium]
MAQVETVRGPVDVDSLGRTLMHEHVFVLNEEIRQNYPGDWNEDDRVDDAIAKLNALAVRDCQTIVDPTVLGLGRDIQRIRRVADGTELNIIVATGLYTYDKLPAYFEYRVARHGGLDPMAQLFIGDITDGIAETGVKAAFLKCAIDDQGLTPGVERVMRAVGRAHAETGAPVTVHTHPHSGTGRDAVRVLREEGADLTKVVLGHSGDSTDLDYLTELADAGCLLGMDRFGLDVITPFEDRVNTVAAMCSRGYASSMVLSHDASCYIDWFPPEVIPLFAPAWHFEHLFDDVLPALASRGVTEAQIETMLVENPRRYFGG